MPQYNIVFLDRGTIGPGATLRTPGFSHHWTEHPHSAPEQVIARLQKAHICITNKVPLRADMLSHLPSLQYVAVAATGTNIVDLQACTERGIAVSNIRGYAATTVAEHTFAVILGLRRNLFQYRQQVIDGAWQRARQFCYFNRPIHDLAGSTLGIIGTGTIAAAVGQRGEAFGMRVIYHSLGGRQSFGDNTLVGLEELLQQADVISLHCPLTPQSAGLFDREHFNKMRKNALLVNTARGDIVDQEALLAALEQGKIAGAAIDVATTEPPPQDSPLMRLADRPDFLLSPHIAWASVQAMQTLADQLIDNLESFVRGQPQNLVG